MISHKHKFIFIHAPKTAGNSIQNLLVDYSECRLQVCRGQLVEDGYPNQFGIKQDDKDFNIDKHSTLDYYYNNWSKRYENIEDFLKIGVARNPWDRAVSFYFWCGRKTFNKNTFKQNLNLKPCFNYFYVKKYNEIKIDYMMKFETLQQDFDNVCDKIGIPRQNLPHVNKSKHKHYTEYYDDETREVVAKKYAKDIEAFDYEF